MSAVEDNQPPEQTDMGNEHLSRGKPRKRRAIFWLLFLIVVIGLGAFLIFSQEPEPTSSVPEQETQPVAMRLSSLEVLTVAESDQQETVRVTGTLRPIRQTVISTRSAGTVEAVRVQPGDTVSTGTIIAELDTAELVLGRRQQQSAIQATSVQLELAQSQLQTARTLVDRGTSPRSALDSAQANYDGLAANLAAQEAQLASIALNLANATIHAPYSGVIAERSIDPGQSVNPGTPVVVLVDTSAMEVSATASLSDATQIAVGQPVAITVESLSNRVFSATVDRISPVAAEGTRTLPVFLTLDNSEGILRGGMFVTGQIVVDAAEDVLTVPTRAVLTDEDGSYVLAIEDDRLVRRAVETGRTWPSSRTVEILEGVSVGDTIVAQELSGLAAGSLVTIEGR